MTRSIVTFTLLTLILTGAVAAPFYFGADHDLLAVVTPISMWLPTLVALTVWLVIDRREPALPEAFSLRRPRGVGIAVTAGIFVAIALGQLLLATALGVTDWALPGDAAGLAVAFAVQLVIMLAASAGEELAWRGWLFRKLRARGFWLAASVTTAVWVIWHLPVLGIGWLTAGDSASDIAVIVLNLAVFGVLLAALRERSGSVWPAVVGHALMNSVFVLTQSNLIEPVAGGALWAWSGLAWMLAIAAIIGLRLGSSPASKKLAGKTSRPASALL